MKYKFLITALIFSLPLAASCFGQPVPRFELSECAVPVPAGENVTCGYLTVPENRTRKNGKTIRLPVIIMKSDSSDPKPDPVLRTIGGPGGSSLKLINGRRYSPWIKDRDMIIFEQRGTKYAQPALECPEVGDALIQSARRQLDEKTTRRAEIAAVKLCRARLVRQGIDLSAYNSAESAADIEDLRRALKLDKINFYGLSYSARLMLNVMRDHPDGIRSVVLESTLPIEVNYDEVGVDGIARVMDEFFNECRADTVCATSYPHLEAEFYALVKNTNEKPFTVNVKDGKSGDSVELKLTGHDIITWLVDYVFSASGREITTAPERIEKLVHGDYTPLMDYAGSKLSPSFYSLGMRYSVWCTEEMPFENRRKIKAQSAKYPGLKGYEVQALPDICRIWKVPAAERAENLPVKSDIPTLVLAAQYDAYTPPAWGKQTSDNLKNSFFFEVPWAGHGPSFNSPQCVSEMVANFIDDPSVRPGPACIDRIRNYFKFGVKP